MRVTLIITTYNWPTALRCVLESVLNQSRLPHEVIVADDGSGDETKELIKLYQRHFPVPLIHSWQEDLGFRAARSRNLAIAKSTGDYLILIDGDMILHEKFIFDHVRYARRGTWVQGVRAKISPDGAKEILSSEEFLPIQVFDRRLKSKRFSIRNAFLREVFSGRRFFGRLKMAQTCNLALFRGDCISVNGFNENFVGWGREDGEFLCRLLNYGVRRRDLKFSAVAYHIHHEGNSRAALERNHQIYMDTINRRLTWCDNGLSKHLPTLGSA